MPARLFGLALILALAVLAWCLWPTVVDVMPGTRHDAAPAAAASDVQTGTATALPAEPAAGAVGRRVEVASAANWLVQGRAMRGEDKPFPNAKVHAGAFHGGNAEGEPAVEAHLTADAAGHFVWPLEPPAVVTFIEVRGEGERVRSFPETFVIAPGDAPPPSFDLWMYPLDAVARGRVLDPQDQPVASARVGVSWQGGVRTDAEGRFELAVQRSAGVTLYAAARGFVELRHEVDASSGEVETELHLRAGSRIHGRVTDSEQRPVAGATVRTFYTIYTDGTETDAGGRFVLDNLDPSLKSHSLFARKAGYVEGKAEVPASAPDLEQDLVLERGVEVRGVVVGPQGQPVPAATVFLGSSPNSYDRLDAVSAADGSFAFACVPAGNQTLNAGRPGFAGKRMPVQVPKAPAPPVVVRVELAAGHFVGGVTKGPDGKPVAGVSISPRLHGEYLEGIRGKTDAQGRFRLDGLPDSGLDLEFHGRSVLRKNVPVATVDRDDLAVVLERHGNMAGTVVDGRTGKPIPHFRIRFGAPRLLTGESQAGGYSAQWVRGGKLFHDVQGVFRIEDEVPIGSVFALEASAEGYGATVNDRVIAVLDPDPAQLVIALLPGVAIEGVVRDRHTAAPIAGARLKAFASGRPLQPYEPNDDEGRPMAVSDERGAFRLANVGTGEISIAVEHADWLPATHGPFTVTGGAGVPPQEVLLDHGATLTVDVRNADGAPMAGAKVKLTGRGAEQLEARSDASGTARIGRVPPGEFELILVQESGEQQVWSFRRQVRIDHDDSRTELRATDGDATLAVILDASEPLPDRLQISVAARSRTSPAREGGFRGRGAAVQPGRTVIANLPATELIVWVMGMDEWNGRADVTTIAGQTTEVHVMMKKAERTRR